jgi:hypothetical protein
MTPSEVLRGVADALDRDDIDLRMTHPITAPEPFSFLGEGTTYLGEKDGQRFYHVPVERVLKHMAKWVHGIRLAAENEAAAEKPRIVVATKVPR